MNRALMDEVWVRIETHAGEAFRQIRGREFTYSVVGNAVKPSTTDRILGRSQFEKALDQVPLTITVPLQQLQGPSYLYAILMDPRIRQANW
jgi:hypothetical protein